MSVLHSSGNVIAGPGWELDTATVERGVDMNQMEGIEQMMTLDVRKTRIGKPILAQAQDAAALRALGSGGL
jgi:hypothetical protein